MKSPRARHCRLLILLLPLTFLGGCATMDVQPWDRDLLAEEAMSFSPEPMITAIDNHIYFSKEGSTGGQEVGGGGCGCN
ncbi:MAG: DUF4266 domain-containing protein [Candidatus Eisenbacteria bacterium]|uniref:DUF4266 domain-containing protein n=1 Tax=Eiseniibacteriota bacterium TaxID=2212470 RepID=A0A956NBH2_UNCEI|nr:DUF4266 domain-containing protein [Candidatus Eisenbacteria bacterium]MCB9464895.1 DUF4266 domain-containing protein [Candidatus Eisenbacteria bacterium]